MKKNGNDYEGEPQELAHEDESPDEDTAELPVLSVEGLGAEAEPGVVPSLQDVRGSGAAGDPSSDARASSWVSGMEAEIQWLQERWQTLDRELRRSEERAGQLRAESDEKDRTIADLNSEIAQQLARIETLNAAIAEREASMASIETAKDEQDAKLAEKSDELNQARGQAAVLEDRLQAALRERDELSRNIGEEKTRLIEISTRSEAIAATNQRLSTRVQDLEIYIEGRKDKWATLNNELESRKARIGEFEAAIAASAKRLEEREAEIDSLRERIVEIERLRSESEGRHKERDSAYQEAQTRLTDQAAEIGRLRATANDQDSGARIAGETAEKNKTEIDSLKQALAEKDQAIRKLETELGSSEALREHIESGSEEERERIGKLQQELAELGIERNRLADGLAETRDEIQALDQKLAEARAGVEELTAENARQQSKIAELEANVEEKSEIIRAFDRNAKRLFALKQNLHALPGDQADESDAVGETVIGGAQPLQRMIVPLDVDPSVPSEYSLCKPVVTIGRSKASDIRILDAVVSRVHAQLTTDKDITIIEDMGSKNGVLVNSQPVDRAVLHHGDVISVGANHEFRYVEIGHATH